MVNAGTGCPDHPRQVLLRGGLHLSRQWDDCASLRLNGRWLAGDSHGQ